ncbi:MAG: DUF5798 family protein [Halapricum sp.]
MGFGDTAKKLQKVTSIAEESYKRMNELREQLVQLRSEVESTSEQVDRMEHDLAEQRALVEALAREQGLDVDAIVTEANIEDVDTEGDDTDTGDGERSEDATGTAEEPSASPEDSETRAS